MRWRLGCGCCLIAAALLVRLWCGGDVAGAGEARSDGGFHVREEEGPEQQPRGERFVRYVRQRRRGQEDGAAGVNLEEEVVLGLAEELARMGREYAAREQLFEALLGSPESVMLALRALWMSQDMALWRFSDDGGEGAGGTLAELLSTNLAVGPKVDPRACPFLSPALGVPERLVAAACVAYTRKTILPGAPPPPSSGSSGSASSAVAADVAGGARLVYLSSSLPYPHHPVSTLIASNLPMHELSVSCALMLSAAAISSGDRSAVMPEGCSQQHGEEQQSVLTADPTQVAQHLARNRDASALVVLDLDGFTRPAARTLHALAAVMPAGSDRHVSAVLHYLGQPHYPLGSDGLITHFVADRIVVPPDQLEEDGRSGYERLIYVPSYYMAAPTLPSHGKPAHAVTSFRGSDVWSAIPERVRLAKGVVFASFGQAKKVDPATFALWCDLLRALPDAMLWFTSIPADSQASVQMRTQAASHGIHAEQRIAFGPYVDMRDLHLQRIAHAHVALDTFAYNAGSAAVDALLHSSVVHITMPGTTVAARQGASILGGPSEWTATASRRDYHDAATRFGSSVRPRHDKRRRWATSRIANRARHRLLSPARVRDLERAVRHAAFSTSPDNWHIVVPPGVTG